MKKNIKLMMLGLVLVGGLNMIGCQSTQDEEEAQEPQKVKIEIPGKKEETENKKIKQLSLKQAEDIAQNWILKNVGSDCDILYEQTAQSEDKS